MIKGFKDFLESEGPASESYRRGVREKLEPKFQERLQLRASALPENLAQKKRSLASWLRLPQLYWKPLAVSLGAAIVVIGVIRLSPTQEITPSRPDAAPLAQASPIEPPAMTDNELALLGERLDRAQKEMLAARQQKVDKSERLSLKKKIRGTALRLTPQVAIEFVRNMDVILVLPILRDLDVLMKWSGSKDVAAAFFDVLRTGLFIQSVYAQDDSGQVLLKKDFMDQMVEIFPKIPIEEQDKFVAALGRLRSIWGEKKEVLAANYTVWSNSSVGQKKIYHDRFVTWSKLPVKTRTQIELKYESWKKLSPAEQLRIRKRLLG